ncbi:MAG: hypothetical protein AB7G76_06310 [Steroidobacteraceae bacterium]
MPKVTEMIQSKFLRKEDIDDDIIVTVKKLALEDMPGDDNEQRWVVYFRELPKGLVLNVTTIRTLEAAFGGDSDDWIGSRVTLFVDPNVSFKGKVVGGLRVRPFKTPKAAPRPLVEDGFNDEIPV